jgi:hypothetical protein
MTATYPKFTPTADPRVRIAQHAPRNFRTEVQDEPGAAWSITGPAYMTRAEALLMVDETVSRHFGEPTHDAIRALRAQVERLTAERDELQRKVFEEKRHNAALLVDGDRKEQRALDLLPDCEAHKRELHYLRHMVSWNWHTMNDEQEARGAIVGALLLWARHLEERDEDATVAASTIAQAIRRAVDKQDKALRRKSYPSLADCLRSEARGCAHDGLSADLVADIAKGVGLGDAYAAAIQRAGDDHLADRPHPAHLCPYA